MNTTSRMLAVLGLLVLAALSLSITAPEGGIPRNDAVGQLCVESATEHVAGRTVTTPEVCLPDAPVARLG